MMLLQVQQFTFFIALIGTLSICPALKESVLVVRSLCPRTDYLWQLRDSLCWSLLALQWANTCEGDEGVIQLVLSPRVFHFPTSQLNQGSCMEKSPLTVLTG